ncbi:MAG: hypothetical protein ABL951_02605 [Alphaproteobacteria bacterium]
MTNRLETTTQRIARPYGAYYLHVNRGTGRVHNVSISIPGTMHGKELGDVMGSLVAAINDEIERTEK